MGGAVSTHAAPYRTPKTGGPLEKDMGPVSPGAVIKLAWNENPFGASRYPQPCPCALSR